MSLAKSLLERVSDIVYHATNPDALYSIMEHDFFRLTAVSVTNASELPIQKGKAWYFMSLSRTARVSGFEGRPVLLILDGSKISQRYSGGPVNYFSNMSKLHNPSYFEYEDRVFSNKPTIPNASKYIKEIHVLGFSDEVAADPKGPGYILHAWLLAKQRGIPFYVYKYRGNFNALDKRDCFTPKMFKEYVLKGKRKEGHTPRKSESERHLVEAWIALIKTPVDREQNLPEGAKNMLDNLRAGWTSSFGDVNGVISRNRKKDFIHQLIAEMQKLGMRDGNHLWDFIKEKWIDSMPKKKPLKLFGRKKPVPKEDEPRGWDYV